MVFSTRFLKNATIDIVLRYLWTFILCLLTSFGVAKAAAAELEQLRVARSDDGVYVSAIVQFDLPPVVEDALLKGIAMFFVVEADVYRERWYWTDRRVISATRTIRLAYQPLTRRWRVNIISGLINSSAGLRATLNQNYDTLPEALSAVQRLSRWRIADSAEAEADAPYKFEFRFKLDLSQLPRPFQIGVAGQKEWNIAAEYTGLLPLERLSTEALKAPAAQATSGDKAKPGPISSPGLPQATTAPATP